MLHIGDYKTAVNTFTEKTFTPAHREMTESLNRDTFDQLVQGIATARKKTPDEVRALIDQGPFNPEDALSAGLVDDLAYLDEVDEKAGLGDLTRTELDDYTRAAGHGLRFGPRRSHRGDLRGRHDQLGPQRRRPATARMPAPTRSPNTSRTRRTIRRSRRWCCASTARADRRSPPMSSGAS